MKHISSSNMTLQTHYVSVWSRENYSVLSRPGIREQSTRAQVQVSRTDGNNPKEHSQRNDGHIKFTECNSESTAFLRAI
jgi:hypothetical protein